MLQELNKVGKLEGCALRANASVSPLLSKPEGTWGVQGDAPTTPGAQLPWLSKAVGWVGVSVAFCEGIFWGCRFCGAWDGACRRCFHFLREQWQVHG